MRRKLFNLLAALSLVLCLGAASVWVAGYPGFILYWQRWSVASANEVRSQDWWFSVRGRIGFATRSSGRILPPQEIPSSRWFSSHPQFEWGYGEKINGLRFWVAEEFNAPLRHGPTGLNRHRQPLLRGNYQEHTVPVALLFAGLAILPLLWVRRSIRDRHRQFLTGDGLFGSPRSRRVRRVKQVVLGYVLASYGFYGLLILLLVMQGQAHHYRPAFWMLGFIAPAGAPIVLCVLFPHPESWPLVPFLFWVGFFALFALAVLTVRRLGFGRGIQEDGLCRRCGYDLRATPERCPECGTAVPQPPPAPSSNPV
ncbi:MAG TPA: hypothetical protein VIL86_13030 [Tepidisphaeraceae bacterium]|jgi:hypothetical protein